MWAFQEAHVRYPRGRGRLTAGVIGVHEELGFEQGVGSPCIFVHPTRGIACSVHCDDFTSTGEKRELDRLEQQLESKYELRKGGRLGPGPDDA